MNIDENWTDDACSGSRRYWVTFRYPKTGAFATPFPFCAAMGDSWGFGYIRSILPIPDPTPPPLPKGKV